MAEVVNDGNRRARLAAMAQGGTAGVEAFDAAQAAASRFQSEAVGHALSTGWHPGNRLVAQDLAGVAQSRTAPYVRDAQLGGTLAGEQVGYDRSAYDSYLRRGEEALDLRRRQMEHERTMAGYSSRLRDAEHNAKLQQLQQQASGFAGSGMDKSELEAYLRGAGMMKQDQEASRAGRQARSAQGRSDLFSRVAETMAKGARHTQNRAAMADFFERFGWDNKAAGIRREEGLGVSAKHARERLARASELDGGVMRGKASQIRERTQEQSEEAQRARARQAAIAEYVTQFAPVAVGMQDARVEGKQNEQLQILADEDRWARDAAIAAGLDPAMALGLFPSSPDDVQSRLEDLQAQRNLEQYGHEDGELGAMKDAVAEAGIREDYADLMGEGTDTRLRDAAEEVYGEANEATMTDLADLETNVVEMLSGGSTLNEAISEINLALEESGEPPLTVDQIRYLNNRFPENVQDALAGVG